MYRTIAGFVTGIAIVVPSAALAVSVSVKDLSPGNTVMATRQITFKIAPDFTAQFYMVGDSFKNSTINQDNIAANGSVSWVPIPSDVGSHTLTLTASSFDGTTATTSVSFTITPLPSIAIQALSAQQVMPGTPVSFTIAAPGFDKPRFGLRDDFARTNLSSANISATGEFKWTPDMSQNGDHHVTVYVSDAQGRSAETTQHIRVGAGPQLSIVPALSQITVSPGEAIRFIVSPSNFLPTGFGVSDSFLRSSITNSAIDANGNFAWAPTANDAGVHTLTIRGVVGAYGESATTSVKVVVLGPGGVVPSETPASALVASAAGALAGTSTSPSSTSVSDLQAKLAELLTKISLQRAQGTASSTPPAATDIPLQKPVVDTTFKFNKFIGLGSRGTDVLRLQERLIAEGYLTVKATGYFGPATKAAVIKYQQAHNIDPRGHVGPGTRAALNG